MDLDDSGETASTPPGRARRPDDWGCCSGLIPQPVAAQASRESRGANAWDAMGSGASRRFDSAPTLCGMEQLVARGAHNPKAAGSSPAPAKSGYATRSLGTNGTGVIVSAVEMNQVSVQRIGVASLIGAAVVVACLFASVAAGAEPQPSPEARTKPSCCVRCSPCECKDCLCRPTKKAAVVVTRTWRFGRRVVCWSLCPNGSCGASK